MSQGRTKEPLDPEKSRQAFVAVAETPEYRQLRSRFRNFAFPMISAAIVAYMTFVLLSIFAVDFMSITIPGLQALNLGLVIGLVQFAIVWIWTALYVSYSNKKLDPISTKIREHLVNEGAV